MGSDLTDLIERVESAHEDTQHIIIYDALVFAHCEGWITDNNYDIAQQMKRSGAFHDAALKLLPPKYDWIVGDVNGHYGGTPYACVGDTTQHFAATSALALAAACLKARAAIAAATGASHEQ